MHGEQDSAIYLYCLARADLPQLDCQAAPKESAAPFRYPFRNLTAVVSGVRLEEYCGPEAEARLQDLAWLGPRACRHEAVIEEVMLHSPIFPVPFGTIFSSSETLQEFLIRRHDCITSFLEQVAHRQEWAVKGLLEEDGARQGFIAGMLDRTLPHRRDFAPGRRYFEEKRLRKELEKAWQLRLESVTRELACDLSRHVSAFCRRETPARRTSPDEAVMLFNWAFLVSREQLPEFRASLDRNDCRLRELGARLRFSGPWPPYSFRPLLA
jgi:hypothetical protein